MNRKAFSLFEIIIVLAVIAIIMGLGWSGLINFRSTSEMQNAYSELVSVIKTIQNKAKNSVSSTTQGQTPDYYALFVAGNKYYVFNCTKSSSGVNCVKDNSFVERILPQSIQLNPGAAPQNSPFCNGIGFARLTGKFVSLTPSSSTSVTGTNPVSAAVQSTGKCTIQVFHNLINAKKDIILNLDRNSLELPSNES